MRYKRRIKLIQPGLQLKLTLAFTLLGAITATFQVMVTNATLVGLAERVSEEGTGALDGLPTLLLQNLVSTLLVFVPLTIAVGILLTHRIAGPVYRFERYLEGIARGEYEGPCRIRGGDMLQGLCDRINDAVASLRSENGEVQEPAELAVDPATEPPAALPAAERESVSETT